MQSIVCCRGSSSWPSSDFSVRGPPSLQAQPSAAGLRLIGSNPDTECSLCPSSQYPTSSSAIITCTAFTFHLLFACFSLISLTLGRLFCSISSLQPLYPSYCVVRPLTHLHPHSLPSRSCLPSIVLSARSHLNVILLMWSAVCPEDIIISLAVRGHAAEPAPLFLALPFIMVRVSVLSLKSVYFYGGMYRFECHLYW